MSMSEKTLVLITSMSKLWTYRIPLAVKGEYRTTLTRETAIDMSNRLGASPTDLIIVYLPPRCGSLSALEFAEVQETDMQTVYFGEHQRLFLPFPYTAAGLATARIMAETLQDAAERALDRPMSYARDDGKYILAYGVDAGKNEDERAYYITSRLRREI